MSFSLHLWSSEAAILFPHSSPLKSNNLKEIIFPHIVLFQKYLVNCELCVWKLNLCLEVQISLADHAKSVKTHWTLYYSSHEYDDDYCWYEWWWCHSLLFDESTHQSIGHTALFSPWFGDCDDRDCDNCDCVYNVSDDHDYDYQNNNDEFDDDQGINDQSLCIIKGS